MKKLLIAALCLGITGLWSCVEDDVYVGPPAIGTVSIDPAAPTAGVDVTVTATITSTVDLESANLLTRVGDGGAGNSTPMTKGANNVYTAVIPASTNVDGAVIHYSVAAKNSAGTTTSAEKSYTVGAAPVDYSKLVINEINGVNKFIEIYNTGTVAINVTGMKLERNKGTAAGGSEITFTTGTIPASGYAVVKCNSFSDAVSPVNASAITLEALPSGLSAQAELWIYLYNPNGDVVDSFYRGGGDVTNKGSYVRNPNGNTTKTGNAGWKATGVTTTTDASNITAGSANPTTNLIDIPGFQNRDTNYK